LAPLVMNHYLIRSFDLSPRKFRTEIPLRVTSKHIKDISETRLNFDKLKANKRRLK